MEKYSSKKKSASLIEQFCSVTGASKDIGGQLLEACNNNLELAINMHMEGGGATQTPGPSNLDAVRAPIPQTEEVLIDEAPAYAAYNRRKRKARSVFDGFRDFQAEAKPKTRGRSKKKGQQEEELLAGGSGARTRKTRTLQDLFRPPLDLIYKGTFTNARDTGKTQGRWLMVNIQNVQEFSCQALNRDIWSNSAVKALIKDSFIFWQVYHDSEEGQRYCQFYKVEGWPYVAILDPTTGENLISWNKIQPVTFCDIIVEFLKKHPHIEGLSPTQPNKRQKREDSLMEASEDDQLQAAITASLTHISNTQLVHTPASDTDSDISDLETFTDSSDDAHSPHKTRARRSSGNQGSPVKGAPCGSQSSAPRRSPRSQSDSDDECNVTCDRAKRTRKQSPLATQSSNEISDKNKKAQTPRQTRNVSPLTVVSKSCQSPSKGSPSKKHNSSPSKPQPSCSPAKSKSIHNDVHPAVIDNIRRTSMSEDEDSRNMSEMTETSGTSEPVESDHSMMDVAADSRDYRKFLGPETDEKMTLMLRLPDGERDKLTLAVTSHLLAVVLYVGSRGYSNERYELVTHFPRRHLSTLDFDSTLRDVGLHTQETVFIQART